MVNSQLTAISFGKNGGCGLKNLRELEVRKMAHQLALAVCKAAAKFPISSKPKADG